MSVAKNHKPQQFLPVASWSQVWRSLDHWSADALQRPPLQELGEEFHSATPLETHKAITRQSPHHSCPNSDLWKHETIQITHKSPHPSLKRHTCALNNFIQQHFWKHTHTHTKPTSLLILCKNSRLVMVKNFIQQHFWKHTKPSPISLFILRKNSRLVSVAGVGDWIITLEGITARVEKKVERQTKAAFGWGKHPKWSAVLLWKHAFNFSLHYKKQNKNNNNCTYTSMKKLTTTAWL